MTYSTTIYMMYWGYVMQNNIHIRNSRDHVYGIWQYKVLRIKKLFRANSVEWKMIGKTWVISTIIKKGTTSTECLFPPYQTSVTNQISFRNLSLKWTTTQEANGLSTARNLRKVNQLLSQHFCKFYLSWSYICIIPFFAWIICKWFE